jgi:outer membrane protein assembly factor BamB
MLRGVLLSSVLIGLSLHTAHAGDARQFRGPERDGKFDEQGLLKVWPEGGPRLLWETDTIGMGYASPAVVSDTIYITGMIEVNNGYLFALNLDGTEKWRLKYGPETEDSQAPGARSTLTVEGTSGFLTSGLGVLYKIDLAAPAVLWKVDTLARFNGKQIQWAIAESPLVDDKYVYCMPGGEDSAVAALDKHTGETVWTSKGLTDASSYCSPNIIIHNGRRILVTMTAKGLAGLDANTGEVLWPGTSPTTGTSTRTRPSMAMACFTSSRAAGWAE